jgi:hypothetical protein
MKKHNIINNQIIPNDAKPYVKKPYLGKHPVSKRHSKHKMNYHSPVHRDKFIGTVSNFTDYYLELDRASNNALSVLVKVFGVALVGKFVHSMYLRANLPDESDIKGKENKLYKNILYSDGRVNEEFIMNNLLQVNSDTSMLFDLNKKYQDYYGTAIVDPISTYKYYVKEGKLEIEKHGKPNNIVINIPVTGANSRFGKRRKSKRGSKKRSRQRSKKRSRRGYKK